ncbi:MAG: methyltransferase domain-containing protein [Deltaproteobacteria bacterium]|nr:methyltransferase domain-containing protein [Deltaproteobacteria bacterium]
MALLMDRTLRLLADAEALGALAAWLNARHSGTALDPRIDERLTLLARELGVTGAPDPMEAKAAAGAIRAFLGHALELIDVPQRPAGWEPPDVMLQSMGQASIAVARAIVALAPGLFDLQTRLNRPGARFLDVGTGAAWLAIELARLVPTLAVDGIDILERALGLARQNIAAQGLEARVAVACTDVAQLDAVDRYEAIWLPGPFLPREVAVKALELSHRALVPGGVLLFGLFGDLGEPKSIALAELRALRSGGHPWQRAELHAAMAAAGFAEVRTLPAPGAPLTLHVARR